MVMAYDATDYTLLVDNPQTAVKKKKKRGGGGGGGGRPHIKYEVEVRVEPGWAEIPGVSGYCVMERSALTTWLG